MPDIKYRYQYRYLNDPTFHMVVDSLRALLRGAQLAPSEIREAAMLACILEEERKPFAVITEEELEKLPRAPRNAGNSAGRVGTE